jgi:hypothetical protein
MLSSSLLIVLRVYVLINPSAVLKVRNQELTEVGSIAIWNRNRVVVASAIGVWVINAASLLQSKPLLPYPLRVRD